VRAELLTQQSDLRCAKTIWSLENGDNISFHTYHKSTECLLNFEIPKQIIYMIKSKFSERVLQKAIIL